MSAAQALKFGSCDLACLGIIPCAQPNWIFRRQSSSSTIPCCCRSVPIQSFADADRTGRRIAVVLNHASTFALKRTAKHAELVGTELPDAAFDLLREGSVKAFAAPREQLLDYSERLPGSRVLELGYGINNAGIAMRQGRPERLAYLSEFVEEAKTSGLIADIIARGNLRGFRVAPAAGAATQA